jgi:UDP-GlcNAc:undecaprenyl-phosphate GlcNAc-1-phosphate transferase
VMPVMDTVTVFLHRMRRGQSPFVGGKDHTTHHLAYLGLSDRQVLYVLAGLAAMCNAVAVLVFYYFPLVNSLVTFLLLMGLVVLFIVVQFVYTRGKASLAMRSQKADAAL